MEEMAFLEATVAFHQGSGRDRGKEYEACVVSGLAVVLAITRMPKCHRRNWHLCAASATIRWNVEKPATIFLKAVLEKYLYLYSKCSQTRKAPQLLQASIYLSYLSQVTVVSTAISFYIPLRKKRKKTELIKCGGVEKEWGLCVRGGGVEGDISPSVAVNQKGWANK